MGSPVSEHRTTTPRNPRTAETSARTDTWPERPALRLRTAATCLPHPKKAHYGGEDAYFISNAGGGAFGVADGVGSWGESGINPAEYSCALMLHARNYLEGGDKFAPGPLEEVTLPRLDPQAALDAAHLNTKIAGSSTACVALLDSKKRMLIGANLGDSGFQVWRGGKVYVKTRPQQHHFDCPYQFQACPEFVEVTDTADMAEMITVNVEPGDIIITASDGLWDNCYESDLQTRLPSRPSDVQDSADRIAQMARNHAGNRNYESPYTKEAVAHGFNIPFLDRLLGASCVGGCRVKLKDLAGGKMDDITVLVSMVEEVSESTMESPASSSVAPASMASAGHQDLHLDMLDTDNMCTAGEISAKIEPPVDIPGVNFAAFGFGV